MSLQVHLQVFELKVAKIKGFDSLVSWPKVNLVLILGPSARQPRVDDGTLES